MKVTPDRRAPRAVGISSTPEELAGLGPLLLAVEANAEDVPALLALAREINEIVPKPGSGQTARLWEILASVTAVDVAAGRILEPHLDAAAIFDQANAQARTLPFTGTWGVFAAEAPGLKLTARNAGGRTILDGSKPWCSLAAQLDHAIVTAHLDGVGRAAFAVDLHADGVSVADPDWASLGLREVPSGTVHFDSVPAIPLGDTGWYYQRPGFGWGGMGVAACWLGGAVAIARSFEEALQKAADGGREPDQLALAHLGEIDRTLEGLRAYLARTAARIDAGELSGSGSWSEALRVRGSVAAAVERIQALVSQNLGPGPLAFDRRYAKRMADLSLYIRQHHAMRDDAQLGALTFKGDHAW
ncbi:acyl-CoA dehydrogenase family protein [Arthrobacter sp. B3I4]|uniref:acyl-CoA dehydrogenase family protein n=1 Tax=Arthrobacter sp. B3I4 TaxID=3042267 RepID=UPI00278AA761|nr:acyl-CoA dehydrogenase family protein [Arthrobacter sp. B3I4]MDQ0754491.1 alkylation response protein AidB-like acyl-CoA dehydrogenase [Arthrobacter sp. B3I4]